MFCMLWFVRYARFVFIELDRGWNIRFDKNGFAFRLGVTMDLG